MSYATYERWKHNRLQRPPEISVVLTAQADEAYLLHALDRVGSYFCSLHYDWELIVCTARGQEKTIERLKALKYANLILVNGETASAALQKGMLDARGGLILLQDIHDSTPVEEAERLFPALIEMHYDIAVGARLDPPQKRNPLLRLGLAMMAQARRAILRLFFNNPVHDPDSGFCLYSGPVARRLFAHLAQNGLPPNVEALYLAGKLKYHLLEVPVGWVKTSKKSPAVRKSVFRLLPHVFKMVVNDLSGKYKHL